MLLLFYEMTSLVIKCNVKCITIDVAPTFLRNPRVSWEHARLQGEECHKANSLGCFKVHSDELWGIFVKLSSSSVVLSFNRSGSYCPYMVGF